MAGKVMSSMKTSSSPASATAITPVMSRRSSKCEFGFFCKGLS